MTLLNIWNTFNPLALSAGLDIGKLNLASCGDPWIGLGIGPGIEPVPGPLSCASIQPKSMSAACFFSPFRLFQKGGTILLYTANRLTVGASEPKYKSERLDVVMNDILTLARERIDNLKNDDDEPWLAGTSRCFWNGMGDLMLDRVVQDLSHADPGVRWVAVKILGWMENLRSLPPLVRALEDTDPDVRQCAKDALKALHGGSENGALRNMMAVLETLGNAQVAHIRMTPPWMGDYAPWDGHFNSIESLMHSLMDFQNDLAGPVLAAIGKPALGRLVEDLSFGLERAMGTPESDAEVRSTAAKVIGQMGHADGAVPLMEAVVKEPSMEVRKEIGFALATCVQAAVNAGKAQNLIACCDRLLSQYPSNALLYSTRSSLHGGMKNHEAELDDLNMAMALVPGLRRAASIVQTIGVLYLKVIVGMIKTRRFEEADGLLLELLKTPDIFPDEDHPSYDGTEALQLVRDSMESLHAMIGSGSERLNDPRIVVATVLLTEVASELARRESQRQLAGLGDRENLAFLTVVTSVLELAHIFEEARQGKTRDDRDLS